MSPTTLERPAALLTTTRGEPEPQQPARDTAPNRGFGAGGGPQPRKRKAGSKRRPALSKADWGPLGKHPDRDAIVARQRLHLPLSGRLSEAQVNQAWKRCAAEHHPDRGGEHDTMQLVNAARDLLLGRDLS
ncbi:MAG: molecular chaperone DnaJ [Cyanobacteriota bacterium]|nr:molecular chaperone DnaJ [Cyanobacteriota bacterium]